MSYVHIIHIVGGGPFDGEEHHFEWEHEDPPPIFILRNRDNSMQVESHRQGQRLSFERSEWEYNFIPNDGPIITSFQT